MTQTTGADQDQPVTLPAERFLRPVSRDAPWFALRFDDLEAGMRTHTTGRTITEADIVIFGGLTGQLHPIHAVARVASRRPFDDATGLVETRLDLVDEDDRLVARGAAVIVWGR